MEGGGENVAVGGGAAYDWDDQISWEDSERFEEDSLCSWLSEPESLCQNWRGWTRGAPAPSSLPSSLSYTGGISNATTPRNSPPGQSKVLSLVDLAARTVAQTKSFEEVEQFSFLKLGTSAPEALQLRIAFWCFPASEDDIRLYSCLANGNADEFGRGENLYRAKAVKDLLQIGFHLSATVTCPPVLVNSRASAGSGQTFSVAVTVDRCRITSCHCTCNPAPVDPVVSWCAHVVAVCLHRIHQSTDSVKFRAPVSESLNHLKEQQLRKFAQYLISELPRQILPTAQKLLDDLLDASSSLNSVDGAPDPTAGASKDEVASWCLDDQTLHENIKKILIKFSVPSPTVFSDVNYLSSSLPPAANEWQSLLRPLRGREPEGLWNLLSIVREMYRRHDHNATSLLHIITEQCLYSDQVTRWWYQTKLSQSGNWASVAGFGISQKTALASSQYSAQYSCASLCDEIVSMWRLAALNPRLRLEERHKYAHQLRAYHKKVVEKIWRLLNSGSNGPAIQQNDPPPVVAPNRIVSGPNFGKLTAFNVKFDLDSFPGFRVAIQACFTDWKSVKWTEVKDCVPPIPGSGLDSEQKLTVACGSDSVEHTSYSPTLPVIREKHTKKSPVSSSLNPTEKTWKTGGSLDSSQESGHGSESELQLNVSGAVRTSTPSPSRDAQPELDEVARLYMYDPGEEVSGDAGNVEDKRKRAPIEEVDGALDAIQSISNPLDVKFARCEALNAHGYSAEACRLAVALAEELMQNPPDLMVEIPANIPATAVVSPTKSGGRKKKKSLEVSVLVHPKAMEVSQLAMGTLEKAIFLFQVLLREAVHHQLAFRIGLFALELPRQPAATKFLEVKMNHLETEVVGLLKRIQLGPDEMHLLRERAQRLRCGAYALKPTSVLPFSLAQFLFESLSSSSSKLNLLRMLGDETLGFEAAIAALALKTIVSEAEHPLLCEGLRRQRCELALLLLLQYKDSHDKLGLIMDRLLDHEMHQMYKHTTGNASFYGQQFRHRHSNSAQTNKSPLSSSTLPSPSAPGTSSAFLHRAQSTGGFMGGLGMVQRSLSGVSQSSTGAIEEEVLGALTQESEDPEVSNLSRLIDEHLYALDEREGNHETEDGDQQSSFSREMSPKIQGHSDDPHIPRGSRHSDKSANPGSSLARASPGFGNPGTSKPSDSASRPSCLKLSRHRRHVTPCLPNQASEAQAHFMTELAKRLLTEAGGNHSTAIFNAPQNGAQQNQQNGIGPHRALHLCAFQIGLYALGLHNKVTPNWLSRTYSSHVSWISGQAMEIGRTAIRVLIDTWENHLTPTEVANLADKASQGREPGMVQAAADLALSALPHAHALNPNEIQRALVQCRDQNTTMLEKACLAVEQAAKDGGVYPEVLFMVARQWNGLYIDRSAEGQQTPGPSTPAVENPQACPPNQMEQRPPSAVRIPYQIPVEAQAQLPVIPSQGINPAAINVHNPHQQPAVFTHHQLQQVVPPFPPTVSMPPFVPHPTAAAAMYHQLALSAAVANGYGLTTTMAPSQHFVNAMQTAAPMAAGGPPHLRPGSLFLASPNQGQLGGIPLNFYPGGFLRPIHMSHSAPNLAGTHHGRHHHSHHAPEQDRDSNMRHMYAAYRVGMLAMETMGRRINDERSYIKYSQNPPYGDDVRWLFGISRKLGLFYTQQFCLVAAQSVVSPFVLWDLAVESAAIFAPHAHTGQPGPTTCASRAGGGMVVGGGKHLLLAPVQPLVQRCFQMFYNAAHQKLSHPRFQPQDGEEVCNLVRAARNAFHQTPGGSVQFTEFLQSLRKQKACKKDLWNKLMNMLSGT